MFQKDRFIEDCMSALSQGQKAIRELVLEAVADPSAIVAELGEPTKPGGTRWNHKGLRIWVIFFGVYYRACRNFP